MGGVHHLNAESHNGGIIISPLDKDKELFLVCFFGILPQFSLLQLQLSFFDISLASTVINLDLSIRISFFSLFYYLCFLSSPSSC